MCPIARGLPALAGLAVLLFAWPAAASMRPVPKPAPVTLEVPARVAAPSDGVASITGDAVSIDRVARGWDAAAKKNAWHENSYPSNVVALWSWEGSYNAAKAGDLNGSATWYAQQVVGHFQASVPPGITLNRYLGVYPTMWAGGAVWPSCQYGGRPL